MRRTLTPPAVVATALTLAFLLPASPVRADEVTDRIQQTKDNNDKNDRAMRERNDSLLSRSRNDSLDRLRARAAGTNQNGDSPPPNLDNYFKNDPENAARYGPAPEASPSEYRALSFPKYLSEPFGAKLAVGARLYVVALSGPAGVSLRTFWGSLEQVHPHYAKQYPAERVVAVTDLGFTVAP